MTNEKRIVTIFIDEDIKQYEQIEDYIFKQKKKGKQYSKCSLGRQAFADFIKMNP